VRGGGWGKGAVSCPRLTADTTADTASAPVYSPVPSATRGMLTSGVSAMVGAGATETVAASTQCGDNARARARARASSARGCRALAGAVLGGGAAVMALDGKLCAGICRLAECLPIQTVHLMRLCSNYCSKNDLQSAARAPASVPARTAKGPIYRPTPKAPRQLSSTGKAAPVAGGSKQPSRLGAVCDSRRAPSGQGARGPWDRGACQSK